MDQGKFLSETVLRTPPFRLMFPALLVPQAMDGEPPEKAKFSVCMVFEKETTDFSLLQQLLTKAGEKLKGPPTRQAFREGVDKLHLGEPFDERTIFANASSKKYQPTVVSADLRPVTHGSEIVQGSYAVAVINAFAYDTRGNRGVAFGLSGIQLLGGGRRIETQLDPSRSFEAANMQPTEAATQQQAPVADPVAGGVVPSSW